MEYNETVKNLRSTAKKSGLTGYSRLKKVDLIELLKEHFILSPLDRPVPSTEEPILQPTSYVPPAPIPQPQPIQAPDWSFLDASIPPQDAAIDFKNFKKIPKDFIQ